MFRDILSQSLLHLWPYALAVARLHMSALLETLLYIAKLQNLISPAKIYVRDERITNFL